MLNGFDKIISILAIPAMWIGSIEWRIRNKMDKNSFDLLREQINRVESHQWDMMKAQNITPTIEPPDKIKNNNI